MNPTATIPSTPEPGNMRVAALAPISASLWNGAHGVLLHLWQGLCGLWQQHRPSRQLRVKETVSLGERRMLAVVEWNGRQLLLGGTANSMALLAESPSNTPAVPALERGAVCQR